MQRMNACSRITSGPPLSQPPWTCHGRTQDRGRRRHGRFIHSSDAGSSRQFTVHTTVQ